MNKQELIENIKDLRDNYPDNGRHDGVRQGLLIAIGAIENLEEPKKVVIPKFVADWIEEMKQDKAPFYSVMSSLMSKTNYEWEWAIWKSTNMNFSEIVAQAWLNGYKVKKEKLYYVLNKHGETLLGFMSGEVKLSGGYKLHDDNKDRYQLTEKQIKDYDERFWSFAVEVGE